MIFVASESQSVNLASYFLSKHGLDERQIM